MKTIVFLLIAIILWAGNSVIGKFATALIEPFSLSFYRWLIASLVLLSFSGKALYQARREIKQNIRSLLILGITGTGIFNTLLYLGLNSTSANNSGIILSTLPIIIIMLTTTFKLEKSHPLQIVGVLVSFLGVIWVISKGKLSHLVSFNLNHGDFIILAAVFSWGIYSVLLRTLRPKNIDPLPFLAIQFLIGLAFVLPFYLYELTYSAPLVWNTDTFLVLIYVGVFPSLIANFCWQQGIALGGANLAGYLYPLITLFTVLFAHVFLGEAFSSTQAMGALLVFFGVVIAFSFKKSV